MAGYGLLILGPSQHLRFNFVSDLLPKWDLLTTLKKIFMGQAIYGPCITTVFFSYNAGLQGKGLVLIRLPVPSFVITLRVPSQISGPPGPDGICCCKGIEGESGSEIVARLKRDLLLTLINGAMFWPVCDFVTFKFVPVRLQPLMNSSCSYLWTIYLTYMASLKKVSVD